MTAHQPYKEKCIVRSSCQRCKIITPDVKILLRTRGHYNPWNSSRLSDFKITITDYYLKYSLAPKAQLSVTDLMLKDIYKINGTVPRFQMTYIIKSYFSLKRHTYNL